MQLRKSIGANIRDEKMTYYTQYIVVFSHFFFSSSPKRTETFYSSYFKCVHTLPHQNISMQCLESVALYGSMAFRYSSTVLSSCNPKTIAMVYCLGHQKLTLRSDQARLNSFVLRYDQAPSMLSLVYLT